MLEKLKMQKYFCLSNCVPAEIVLPAKENEKHAHRHTNILKHRHVHTCLKTHKLTHTHTQM